jgi:hypothetical protein
MPGTDRRLVALRCYLAGFTLGSVIAKSAALARHGSQLFLPDAEETPPDVPRAIDTRRIVSRTERIVPQNVKAHES